MNKIGSKEKLLDNQIVELSTGEIKTADQGKNAANDSLNNATLNMAKAVV